MNLLLRQRVSAAVDLLLDSLLIGVLLGLTRAAVALVFLRLVAWVFLGP